MIGKSSLANHDSWAPISALYSVDSRQCDGVAPLVDSGTPGARSFDLPLVCSPFRASADDCRCCALFQLPVGLHFHREGNASRMDAPVVFVSKGPYRFVRNPMYLAIVGILVGEALFFRSAILGWMAVGFAVGFHLFVVVYEERALTQRFGASYERYCFQVSRWLPRWPDR